jgi:LacI family transcriptional regulator
MIDFPRVAIFLPLRGEQADRLMQGAADYALHRRRLRFSASATGDIPVASSGMRMNFDGIVVDAYHYRALTRVAVAKKIPVVDVSGDHVERGLPNIAPDDLAVGAMAAEDLLNRGFNHFAFIGLNRKFSRLRQRGFERGLARRGKSAHTLVQDISEVFGDPWARDALARFLISLPRPIALFAATDFRARYVIPKCEALGIKVPEELAVLSCDNDEPVCQMLNPPLSSIPLNSRRTGWEAAAMLDRLMQGESLPASTVLIPPLPIAQRRSSDAMAVADPDVHAAMRFIWERSNQPISVDDVIQHVAVSHRSLQLRFQKELGRTIRKEIARVRIERVKHLLSETTSSISQIAEDCGFRDVQTLSQVFRRLTGITPRTYRQRSSLSIAPIAEIDAI